MSTAIAFKSAGHTTSVCFPQHCLLEQMEWSFRERRASSLLCSHPRGISTALKQVLRFPKAGVTQCSPTQSLPLLLPLLLLSELLPPQLSGQAFAVLMAYISEIFLLWPLTFQMSFHYPLFRQVPTTAHSCSTLSPMACCSLTQCIAKCRPQIKSISSN